MIRAQRSIARCTAALLCAFASHNALAEPTPSQEQNVQSSQTPTTGELAGTTASQEGATDQAQKPPCARTDLSVLPVYVPPSRGQARLRAAAATRGS